MSALQEVATRVASVIKGGDILLLSGELGTGKTTFTQALLKALGVEEPVTSPTFTIVSEYAVTGHPTIKRVAHIDLYRLTPSEIATDSTLQDIKDSWGSAEQLTIIEWADKLTVTEPAYRSGRPAYRLAFRHGTTSTERIVELDPALAVRF
ncbi:MAG: tRNA (adenosine(37)-N6)-threonylcarbamoyltransferase complex ATPase subunit type 1 TsaE [Candidatus Andersenbacteria bacterium]